MGYTTSYWQKERWSRRVADMLTSYELCWNPSLDTWDVKWRVGVECQRRNVHEQAIEENLYMSFTLFYSHFQRHNQLSALAEGWQPNSRTPRPTLIEIPHIR